MKKISSLVVFILGVSLVLSACGGGGGTASSTTINVTMTEFQFTPSTFVVPAGQQITLNAKNGGTVEHSFVIMKYGTTAGDTFDDQDKPNVYYQLDAQPGTSQTETFTAPTQPGDYQVVCSMPGHIAAGMVAKMTVVAK